VDVEISSDDFAGFALGGDVDIEIVTDEAANVIRVPKKAVFSRDGQDCVFTAEDGRARLKTVEVGVEGKDFYEITANLAEGEHVIVSPDGAIDDGARVKVSRP
jgi:HlyD family secretion protein